MYALNLQTSNEESQIISTKTNLAKLITSVLQIKFSEKMKTIELEGDLPAVQNVEYANYINASLKGIPSNVDLEKRQSADRILKFDKDFNIVFFAMPNGDLYIQEPYSAQINNKVLNFAFRDWFKGAITTHQTYVSEAYISQATDREAVGISEPIYSANGTLKGVWVGLINLNSLEEEVSELDFSHNTRIIITDHKGHSIMDTKTTGNNTSLIVYTSLASVNNALAGKSGSIISYINGTKMFSVYEPATIGTHTWAVVLMQPYDDAFGVISDLTEQRYITIGVIMAVIGVSGFFMYRMIRSNEILTKKLRDADTAKEEFATMVTHELKTPLVTINGYSEMLKESGILGTLNPEQEDVVDRIYASSKKLENLIGDILVAQKLELNKMHFNKTDFDVGKFMNDIAQTYSSVIKDKQIQFKNITTEKLTIKTDKDRLSQVLDNLIRNSIDFVPAIGGKIEIGAKSKNENIEFFVKDDGVGIPKDKQVHLFQKFYQVDSSLKRQHGGTGLGLVICKGMVEGLGGKIWIESEPGKGTIVYFSIPKNDLIS